MISTRLFTGNEDTLTIYNGQAAIDQVFHFYTKECSEFGYTNINFDFPGFQSAYFRVFNERSGREIKDIVMTQQGRYLILNASALDMTFEPSGWYYYEIGYVNSIYEQVLRYGVLRVI